MIFRLLELLIDVKKYDTLPLVNILEKWIYNTLVTASASHFLLTPVWLIYKIIPGFASVLLPFAFLKRFRYRFLIPDNLHKNANHQG
ncbi:MAG: hypothetical protein DWQ10_13295 [Calditrichaeota bacterium]|nr:MAG: hypothetical protein DWQ10_13295 [Calditrichota bacterium]